MVGVFLAADMNPNPQPELSGFLFTSELFLAIPVVALAFTCHLAVPPIIKTIENPTEGRVDGVMRSSLSAAGFIYAFLGLTVYITYGNGVQVRQRVSVTHFVLLSCCSLLFAFFFFRASFQIFSYQACPLLFDVCLYR